MKKALVFLVAGIVAGCGRPPVPVFNAERVADGKADELAGNMWGKVEYAPKQYAGFAYDPTGVYGNLHGVGPPEIISLRFRASKGHRTMARREIFLSDLMHLSGHPSIAEVIRAAPTDGRTEEQFKWLFPHRARSTARASRYDRTFWISWKALGLDSPPAEGELRVSIWAMERKGTGASFLVDAKSTR